MKQAVLSHWDLPWLPLTALILFVACFSAYTWWTYRRANKTFYQQASLVPLEDAQPAQRIVKGNRYE